MNTYLLLPLIQIFFSLILMAVVLRSHFRSFMHRLFSLYLLCLAIWGIVIFGMRASPDIGHAYNWEKWIAILAPVMAVIFYHFTVRFTGIIINKWLLPAAYAACVIFASISRTGLIISGMKVKSFGFIAAGGPVFPLWGLFSYVLLVMAFRSLWRLFRHSPLAEERNRSTYVMIGLGVSLLGGFFDVLPILGLPLYPGAIIGNIIFCLLTTVAILKHNLLDIRIVVRKSIAYFLTSAAMAIPVIGLFFLATYLLAESPAAPWVYFFLIIILAFSVPALWRLMQRQVDRWFYRDRYDYLKALETFSWHAQSLSDISGISENTVKMLAGALRSSNVYLLQPLSKSGDFQVVCDASGTGGGYGVVIKAQSPLLKWLQRSSGLLRSSDIPNIPQLQNVAWEENELLERIGVELIVPLKGRGGRISGLLMVGKKMAGQPYSIEDTQMAATTGNQIAVTLENMRLYRDILESRQNLEMWLNSMGDCVIIVDANQAIQFMNQAAVSSFGSSAAEKCWQLLGKQTMCLDCPVPGIGIQIDNRNSPKLIGNRTIADVEYEVATAPLLNPDGSQSIIEVFRDVTERKRLEKEVIQAQVKIEALKQSERLKTDLLSMVSHELRTPLAVIKGQVTTLLRHTRKGKDGEKLDFLRDIDQATDSLARLVGNLLDMSSLDAGAMKLEKDYYQISEILEWATKSLKVVTRGHPLSFNLPSKLPPVLVDRMRIGQILINLCENAAKYSDAGSRIRIEAEASDGEVLVSVVDEGKGIPPEYRERVFERFFRIGNNDFSNSGVGLGLAICRGIVEAHGGRIRAEDASGRGSRLVFSLPVNGEESRA
jgi:signal transduction histidine kinase